jgi:hypothetical protein
MDRHCNQCQHDNQRASGISPLVVIVGSHFFDGFGVMAVITHGYVLWKNAAAV